MNDNIKNLIRIYRKGKRLGVISDGENWYYEAHDFAQYIADKYLISIEQAAGVISALSPGVTWEQNKRDADAIVSGFVEFIDVDNQLQTHKFSTYLQNVYKAERILHETENDIVDYFSPITAPKTRAFYLNILHPYTETDVCIDRHALAAWEGRMEVAKDQARIGLPKYRQISEDYKAAAKKLGYLPHEFQAVVWVSYKVITNR